MNSDDAVPTTVAMETERLLLRTWEIGDAAFHRQLWSERDIRVPAHRRLSDDGHPHVAEMEKWLRSYRQVPAPGLLVVQLRDSEVVVGYCGLIENNVGRPDEPELAFEFLRAFWNHGYATEAASAIVTQARVLGYQHLVSTVRAWNAASLRVLAKLGFVYTGEQEDDDVHGDSLLLRKTL